MCQEACCPRRLADPTSLEDWRCSCLCSELIPSVTEKSVIFIKELLFPQTAPIDDAFFQPELGWSVFGLLGRSWAGLQAVRRRVWGRTTAATDRQALDVALPYKKNQKEEGLARASPVAAPMPKSASF